jgi:hypothetical protein
MNKAKDIFKSNVNEFYKDVAIEHVKRLNKDHKKTMQQDGASQISGVYKITPTISKDKGLVMKYRGQAFFNIEFGKGDEAGRVYEGLPRLSSHSLQQEFIKSAFFRSFHRNPRRGKRYKEKVYTGERTKPYPISVKSKKGTRFTRYITRQKYVMRKEKDTTLHIYSRPDGYTDIDGQHHDSDMPVEVWLEKPNAKGKLSKPKLSMKGAFSLQRFWGYDFTKGAVVDNSLQKTDAYETFEENLITEIEEYLFDK